ncbi:MAG: AAA family ATPase [Parcubacteria group bacterium]|nr:AAA family ATPase [Parcubacteria group bacterium]
MALVIGLVGKPGRGKGSCVRLISKSLQEYGAWVNIVRLTFSSDILRPELERRALPFDREHCQKLAQEWETTEGVGALSRRMHSLIQDYDGAHVIFVDGVRWPTDFAMLRSLPHNLLLYVHCAPETAHKRLTSRKEKEGEQGMSLEEFLRLDGALNEQFVEQIGERADYAVPNETTDETMAALESTLKGGIIPRAIRHLMVRYPVEK